MLHIVTISHAKKGTTETHITSSPKIVMAAHLDRTHPHSTVGLDKAGTARLLRLHTVYGYTITIGPSEDAN